MTATREPERGQERLALKTDRGPRTNRKLLEAWDG